MPSAAVPWDIITCESPLQARHLSGVLSVTRPTANLSDQSNEEEVICKVNNLLLNLLTNILKILTFFIKLQMKTVQRQELNGISKSFNGLVST